jgi:hypothetical protein
MTPAFTHSRRTLLLALAFSAVTAGGALAQQPGTRSSEIGRPADKQEEITIGRYVFAGIGVDDYHRGEIWDTLDNAVNDVMAVRAMLTENFGFESPDEWILTNEDATRSNISALLDDLYTLGPDDNLVFFFAGHGISVAHAEETQAYLVPVDVKAPAQASGASRRQYLQIEDILGDLAELDARHVVAIFDACEAGLALSEGAGLKTRGGSNFTQPEVLMARKSRHVMTSATEEQKAFDGSDERPDNSLFTGWLLEGLQRAADGELEDTPDADGDGALTVTEIAEFVNEKVSRGSRDAQTPDHGTFELDRRGELVITLQTDPFDDLFREAVEFYDEWKIEQLTDAVDRALERRDEGPRVAYLRYLRADATDDPANALPALQQLDALREGRDVATLGIPMSQGAFNSALRRAERDCKGGRCSTGGDGP